MGAARACSTHSLGAVLERDRLERRVGRLTIAIAVLRHRNREDRRNPGAPRRHVRQAIADFEAQIDAMNSRLRDLAPDGRYVSLARYDQLSKGKAQ
jgi:GAF domain-containing protein